MTMPAEARRELRAVLRLWLPALAATALAAFARDLPVAGWLAQGLVLLFIFYLPAARIMDDREPFAGYGVAWRGAAGSVFVSLAVAAVIFPLFFLGYHLINGVLLGATPVARLAERPLYTAFEQIAGVALPEEFFYRGFIQTRLQRAFPGGVRLLGVPVGPAIVLTSALFAVVHIPSGMSPARLATFFPSLLFCWLRAYTGNIAGPIVVHGLANLLLFSLQRSYSG